MTSLLIAATAAAVAGMGLTFQQLLARTHLLEVALSNGFAPTSQASSAVPTDRSQSPHAQRSFDADEAQQLLAPGSLTVLVTASCTSCRRLIADLADTDLAATHPVSLWFDRAQTVSADTWNDTIIATASSDRHEDIDRLGIGVFPHAVLVADGQIAHAPVADLDALNRFLGQHGAAISGPGLVPPFSA